MMLPYFRKKYILIFLHLLVLSSSAHRKAKKARDLKISPPKYEIYSSDKLPSDVQVTKYLLKDQQETFSYWSTLVNGTLSISIIPCTSIIQWSFKYIGENPKAGRSNYGIDDVSTDNITMKSFFSQQGAYELNLKALRNDTYVHIYISTEIGGPQALRSSHADNLRLHHKERRKSASLKWNQSLVDPQSTDYCLVISTKKQFNSLCSAQASRLELPPSQNQINRRETTTEIQTLNRWRSKDKYTEETDPMIACTGKKTQYTISNLKEGKMYYYNLFAINKQSNLTYPYGSVNKVFKGQIKPVSLKNGFGQAVLRGSEEEAIFRYKIDKKAENDFNIFVIPCGGPVDVKLLLKGEPVLNARKIESFRKLTVKNSSRGARYQIKVFTNSGEEYRKTSGVQIYASKRAISKIPMITVPKLEEYESLRECHSVTVGWILVSDPKPLHYCVKAKEGRLKETDNYRIPNQCGLDRRRKKSDDFETKYCMNIKQVEIGKVNTYKIRGLESGKTYIIQVTVQKQRGKTLSYELLQVNTKKCFKRLN
ncbi:protein NDNF-like [Harmonia axyridis]|uniref:protein NDNF-like n=1 Tax=Harmonia axyridis TaxID=115357 RepID=UPI001E2794A3|nr:protein NDNF-like [Harmonia axyridis]